jgi:DNA-binding NarL/FixJ family response regulator
MERIKIGLVEDDKLLRSSLSENISYFEEIELVFTAAHGEQAIQLLATMPPEKMPQVILMDIEMPILDGIATTTYIKKQYPHIKVIMFTVFENDSKIFDAILAGASGYILKDEKLSKIVTAIYDAVDGGAPMSSTIALRALQLIRQGSNPATPTASPVDFQLGKRETEILELIAQGFSYQQIAEKCFISPKTVRKHIENIYQKLQVHSKFEAVQIAMKNNWFRIN